MADETTGGDISQHPNFDPEFAEKIKRTQEMQKVGGHVTTFESEQKAAQSGERSPDQQISSLLDAFNTKRYMARGGEISADLLDEERQATQGKLSLLAQQGVITGPLREKYQNVADKYGLKLTTPEPIEPEPSKPESNNQGLFGRITGMFTGKQEGSQNITPPSGKPTGQA